MNQKLQWLRNKMSSLDMQGMILSNPINIKYLTNIDAEGTLILTRKENIYITDLALSENFYKKIKESGYAYKFKIFDHHKTHLFAKDYENVVIDIEECGTTLFYNYLSKKYKFKKIVEDYIKHVKNLDLWLWVEKFDFMAKELGNIFDLYGRNTYIEEMYQKLKRGKKFKWNTDS